MLQFRHDKKLNKRGFGSSELGKSSKGLKKEFTSQAKSCCCPADEPPRGGRVQW